MWLSLLWGGGLLFASPQLTAQEPRVANDLVFQGPDESAQPNEESSTSSALANEVWLTVTETALPADIAAGWGLWSSQLLELNPQLEEQEEVSAGTPLLCYRRTEDKRALSIERPNDGKLWWGYPMPEGLHWILKSRRKQWGSELTVETLVNALNTFAKRYPDAAPVVVGDLSRKRGGDAGGAHASHQSGRDVDLGLFSADSSKDQAFVELNTEELDLELTWGLIHSLIESGKVQVIFLGERHQRALSAYLKEAEGLSSEELAKIFEYPARKHSHEALIQAWDHHNDHMHVRFVCAPDNWRCRGHGSF